MTGSRDHGGEYALWQKRFWEHTIRDDGDFERCADYIHFNPVKHRFASLPAAGPFSSLHRYARAGVLARDWGGGAPADNINFGGPAAHPPFPPPPSPLPPPPHRSPPPLPTLPPCQPPH